MRRRPDGEPMVCGMCGHAVIGGLMFNGKKAYQAMTNVGIGRVHLDRELCSALKGMTDDKLEMERSTRAKISTAQDGGLDNDAIRGLLYPVDSVGVDKGSDGGA